MHDVICSCRVRDLFHYLPKKKNSKDFIYTSFFYCFCWLKCITEQSHTLHVTAGLASTRSSWDSMQTSYTEQSHTKIDWWLKWLFQQTVEYHTAFPLLWHFSWNGLCQCWGEQLDIPSFCHTYSQKYNLSNICNALFWLVPACMHVWPLVSSEGLCE